MDANNKNCSVCGSPLVFDPTVQRWVCSRCGVVDSVANMDISILQDSAVADMIDQLMPDTTIDDLDIYRCRYCGSEVMTDKNTISSFCIYCGSKDIVKNNISNSSAPSYIIPFKINKKPAIKKIKRYMMLKLLKPFVFRNSKKNIERIRGVYVPFWAYDLEANGEVEFETGDIESWNDGKFKYKKFNRFSIRKSGHFDFKKVIADASSRFPDDLLDALEPFDYNALTKYNHRFLSGVVAERYDVAAEQGLNRVSGKCNTMAVKMMENTIEHQKRSIVNNGVRVSARYTHYILLPIWMLNIKYHKKVYTIAMNGQTGKIIGQVPISVISMFFWLLVFFCISFVATGAFALVERILFSSIVSALLICILLILNKIGFVPKKTESKNFINKDTMRIINISEMPLGSQVSKTMISGKK